MGNISHFKMLVAISAAILGLVAISAVLISNYGNSFIYGRKVLKFTFLRRKKYLEHHKMLMFILFFNVFVKY